MAQVTSSATRSKRSTKKPVTQGQNPQRANRQKVASKSITRGGSSAVSSPSGSGRVTYSDDRGKSTSGTGQNQYQQERGIKRPSVTQGSGRTKADTIGGAPQRSQQFKDTQKLNKATGGGLQGTRQPTNLERKAPKPAWKEQPRKPDPAPRKPTVSRRSRVNGRVVPGADPRGKQPAAKPAAAPKPQAQKPTASTGGRGGLTGTIRATGDTSKHPWLEKYKPTDTGRSRLKVSQGSGIPGGTGRLGAAVAGIQAYNTGDSTLKAAQKRGDYKPKQGPADPDRGLSKASSFDKAFAAARKSGKKTFDWNGKQYTTETK